MKGRPCKGRGVTDHHAGEEKRGLAWLTEGGVTA
jgi:hypothetical protein